MNLITYPQHNVFDFVDEISNWMDRSHSHRPSKPTLHWPRVNAWERENEYLLEAEVPGMTNEDIHLELLNDHLVIKGIMPRGADKESPQYKIWEFEPNNFERSFWLGETINQDKISAKTEHGMLYVNLPKKAKAQLRKIEITPGA